ncbi:MAG: hypothetical protein AUH17_05770 [Actinobacteria bacterium 13_2_20CM_68_14]|nr:MAG: hypothetical protein AUH17_05770 [Actinobacteria bacterium 13_2_20CM_68_14]
MRRRFTYFVLAALVVLAAGASSTFAARDGEQTYVFNGRLLADAGSSTSLYVDINGGNRPALKKLVGQSDNQYFAVDSGTQFLRWSHGVPTVVAESNLVAADIVSVQVRAARDASLAQIEATPASRVADRGPTPGHAGKPLWLFVGSLNAPAANGKVTIHVQSGNWLALRKMLGQPQDQSFSYGARTIFILWRSGVPTVVSPSQLRVGDRISIRIRAPRADSLQEAEQVPASHIGDHEPRTPA